MILSKLRVGSFIAPDYRSPLGQYCYKDFCKEFGVMESGVVTAEMGLTKHELRKLWKERFSDSSVRALCSPQINSEACGHRILTFNEKIVPYPSPLAPCIGTISAELANYVICERLNPYEVRISGKEFRLGASIEFCRKRLLESYFTNTYFYIVDFQTKKAYVVSISCEDCIGVDTLREDMQICAELIKYNYIIRR